MVDYLIIGISIVIFILYLAIIVMSIELKRRLDNKMGATFIFVIISILFLMLRRLQQIFETEIGSWIPYFSEITTLVFAFLFFMAIASFYRAVKKAGSSRKSTGSLKDYKRSIGGKIIR